MTREVLGAVFRYEDVHAWTVTLAVGEPPGPDLGAAAAAATVVSYTATATFIPHEVPGPDGAAGELRIATATRDDDRELVCRFVVALVAAATGGSPEPPELES